MEITFEFEDSDLIVDFEPDFDVDVNFCDIERVAWNFQDGNHTPIVASMLSGAPEYEYPSTYIPPTLRLFSRRNED
jgi:hypothetical protein